jgi:hypothetical protein
VFLTQRLEDCVSQEKIDQVQLRLVSRIPSELGEELQELETLMRTVGVVVQTTPCVITQDKNKTIILQISTLRVTVSNIA